MRRETNNKTFKNSGNFEKECVMKSRSRGRSVGERDARGMKWIKGKRKRREFTHREWILAQINRLRAV